MFTGTGVKVAPIPKEAEEGGILSGLGLLSTSGIPVHKALGAHGWVHLRQRTSARDGVDD